MHASIIALFRSLSSEQGGYTVTRSLMKLFRTRNTDIIRDCCIYFNFKL